MNIYDPAWFRPTLQSLKLELLHHEEVVRNEPKMRDAALVSIRAVRAKIAELEGS